MNSDARRLAEEALLVAVQRRLREPGSEYRTVDLLGTGVAALIDRARSALLPPSGSPGDTDAEAGSPPVFDWETGADIRLAPPVGRVMNDPVIVDQADRSAEHLQWLGGLRPNEEARPLSARAAERVLHSYFNRLVLDLVDLEGEFNLSPNQAWLLYLGALGDAAEDQRTMPADWHRAMEDRLRLVISHEQQHPLAQLPFEDRSISDDVVLLKLDKHYDEQSWLHLHALLSHLATTPITPDAPQVLLHEAWNEHEILLAATPVDAVWGPKDRGSAPRWLTNLEGSDNSSLATAVQATSTELGRYVPITGAPLLGGRAVVANGQLSDWFQMPGRPTLFPASPSFSFNELLSASTDETRSRAPAESTNSTATSSNSARPEADEPPESPFAASLGEAIARRDGGPGSTYHANGPIAYVQARSVFGKGSRLEIRKVIVAGRPGDALLISVVVERVAHREQARTLDLYVPLHEVELANWSGWSATLKAPSGTDDDSGDSRSVSPSDARTLWEGTMELDLAAPTSAVSVTERLEELLRRLLGEGFQRAEA